MCGIFATIGDNAVENTLNALAHLEYRGYDSVGIAYKNMQLQVQKCVGRVEVLRNCVANNATARLAIGHTRWATHGAVCQQNAHPFLSADGNFAVVHNGIIENHISLKNNLQNYPFTSSTDSEVVTHLLQRNYNGEVIQSLQKTAKCLKGAYAIVVATNHDDNLYALKRRSPLVVGVGKKGVYLCSDIRCIARFADKVAITPDDTLVVANQSGVQFFHYDGKPKRVDFFSPPKVDIERQSSEDMMFSEICQIPQKITQAKKQYFQSGGLNLPKNFVKNISRIYLVGCGTAYHSGLQVSAIARNFLQVDIIPVVANEFVYDNYPVDGNTIAFLISQSGETADTLLALEKLNERHCHTYAVTNNVTSTLATSCKNVTNISADGEFAVASTKAYNCQLITLLLIMLDIAKVKNTVSKQNYQSVLDGMDKLPVAIDQILCKLDVFQDIAQKVKDSSAVFFLGKRLDYPTACEGSLKLKEITYIHSEAYPAGELKHGTLALMERGVTVIALSTNCNLTEKMDTAIAEVTSRGADVVAISPYQTKGQLVTLPVVHQWLYPVIAVVPLQLIAYYTAKALGRDVDKPRNLAKSVTVE